MQQLFHNMHRLSKKNGQSFFIDSSLDEGRKFIEKIENYSSLIKESSYINQDGHLIMKIILLEYENDAIYIELS